MEIKELMQLNVNNLRQKQQQALKCYAIDRLQQMIKYLEEDNFEGAKSMLEQSTDGDDGTHNQYISFDYTGNDQSIDIGYIIEKLDSLTFPTRIWLGGIN